MWFWTLIANLHTKVVCLSVVVFVSRFYFRCGYCHYQLDCYQCIVEKSRLQSGSWCRDYLFITNLNKKSVVRLRNATSNVFFNRRIMLCNRFCEHFCAFRFILETRMLNSNWVISCYLMLTFQRIEYIFTGENDSPKCMQHAKNCCIFKWSICFLLFITNQHV